MSISEDIVGVGIGLTGEERPSAGRCFFFPESQVSRREKTVRC